MDFIKDYLPLIATLLTLFFGYVSTLRYKKNDRFYAALLENLKEISSPLYLSLRKIVNEEEIEIRDKMIGDLFVTYGSPTSKIYLLNNDDIVVSFYKLEDKYKLYQKYQSDEYWEEFWIYLYDLFIMMEDEYWKNFNTINGEFRWHRDVSGTQNYLHRALKEVIRIMIDTLNFLGACIVLFLAFGVWMKILGRPIKIPDNYRDLVVTIFTFILLLWGLMTIIGAVYLAPMKTSLRKNPLNRFVGSILTKKNTDKLDYFKKWEVEKMKKRINIPERGVALRINNKIEKGTQMGYISELRKLVGTRPVILTGVTVIVLNEEKNILLQKRRDTLDWGVIGGALELSETFEEAAKRELYEEAGLNLDELRFITVLSGSDMYYKYPHGDEVYNAVVVFEALRLSGVPSINDNEGLELKFFSLKEPIHELNPMAYKILKKSGYINW